MSADVREFPADPETLPFSEERRHRLVAACLGAAGNEIVTVRAADLRACLDKADAVDTARELIGANASLRAELANARAEAAETPRLREQILALQGHIDALNARAALVARILTGKAFG